MCSSLNWKYQVADSVRTDSKNDQPAIKTDHLIPTFSRFTIQHGRAVQQRGRHTGLLGNTPSRGGESGHLPVFAPYIAQDIGFIHGLAGAFRRGWSDCWRWGRTGAAAE